MPHSGTIPAHCSCHDLFFCDLSECHVNWDVNHMVSQLETFHLPLPSNEIVLAYISWPLEGSLERGQG